MNTAKIMGICNRIKLTPQGGRGSLLGELCQAIDEEPTPGLVGYNSLDPLRDMLDWPEVKASPRATARIARTLRDMRDTL